MEQKVDKVYDSFNTRRKVEDANQADRDDLDELKRLDDNTLGKK